MALAEKRLPPTKRCASAFLLVFRARALELPACSGYRSVMPQPTAKLNAFPVFMRVEGEAVVIVGGGEEALAKARLLGQSSAVLRDRRRCAPRPICLPGSPRMARRISTPTTMPAHLDGAVHGVCRERRRGARPPRLRRRAPARHSGQRRRPAGTLRFLHPGDRQPRAGLRWRSAPKAPARCWPR